ncbi:MAG: glycoside hydrolase domain-containing protein [Planctomycetota bacterium]
MAQRKRRFHVPIVLTFLLALAAALCPAADGPTDLPLVTVTKLGAPPVLDGKIAAGEWDRAAATCAFCRIDNGHAASRATLCLLGFDEQNLYVAFQCQTTAKPKAAVKTLDGAVWEDDAVELFLQPKPATGDYFQFIGNSIGATWDSKGQNPKWNTQWKYAASVQNGRWEAELAIPFFSLAVTGPQDGAEWRINLARDAVAGGREISAWSWPDGTLHNPERFGAVRFVRGGTAVRLTAVGDVANGKVGPTIQICAPEQDKSDVEFALKIVSDKKTLSEKKGASSVPGKGTVDLRHDFDVKDPGTYSMQIEVKAKGGAVIHRTELPFTILPAISAHMIQMQLSGRIALELDARGAKLPPAQLRATADILAPGDRVLVREVAGFKQDARATVVLDISHCAVGEHEILVRLWDAKSKEIGRTTMSFTRQEKPTWLGSRAGVTDEVMPPWTPMQLHGGTVHCWERNYKFAAEPWPSEITTQGESILAGPIRLRGRIGEKEIVWQSDMIEVEDASDSRVVLSSRLTSDALILKGDTRIEYDGMIRMDMELIPKGEQTLDDLTMDIPLKKDWATLYHFWPGRWGSTYNSNAIPADGLKIPFKPLVWVGKEEGGLAWFAESDENWSHKKPEEVIEIIREGETAVLRVHVISEPITIDQPRYYTIGLQATPVKPIPPDWREWRICHGAGYGMSERVVHFSHRLTYPVQGHIRTDRGTFEAWVRVDFDPNEPIANPSARGQLNRNFFLLQMEGERQFGFYWNIDDRGMRAYAKEGSNYPIILGSKADWKKGEFHHIALTWGDEMRIYADGKLVASRKYAGLMKGNIESASLALGGGQCDFLVDEIRISDIPRDSFDLTKPPAKDDHTLLLDHFDGAHGGEVEGKAIFENAKFGKGLVLHETGPAATALDRAAELGVKTLVFHEHWTDIQNYTETTHKDDLKKLVSECHKRGIKLLLYFGYEISNIAPEWPIYSEDCLTKLPGTQVNPKGGYHRSPEQRAYTCCYNSPWQDFLADGIEHVLKTYDIDGVYLDGTIEPWGCQNYLHGCSYLDKNGKRQPTYPIFAVRNLMKRIYNLCTVQRKGLVSAHQSTCCTTPTLAFTSSYWDGEQLGSLPDAEDPASVIPLDAFRAEFMGRNFGLPCEFLVYPPHPYTIDEGLAFTMLHDVPVRPGGVGPALEDISRIWNVWTDFGASKAEWLPYWRNGEYVSTSPASVKVSIYNRGPEGALLVVSNLGGETVDAKVDLHATNLKLPANLQGQDALTKVPVPIPNGTITLKLPRLTMKMIRVSGQN